MVKLAKTQKIQPIDTDYMTSLFYCSYLFLYFIIIQEIDKELPAR